MSFQGSCAAPRRAAKRGLMKVWLVAGLALAGTGALHAEDTPRLAFRELLAASPAGAEISPRAKALAGHRVTLVGFMAKMEVAPKGGFYLTPRPVACDEEGGGTADLPPESVFVIVRSSPDQDVPWSPRALEVSGVLEAGYRLEPDQRVTHFRLLLDRPQDLPGASTKP
jgi:hypothetical protein